MKRLIAFIACLALASPAFAQSTKVIDPSTGLPVFSSSNPASVGSVDSTASGTITAISQAVALALNGKSGATIQITGTWVGTLQFEGTVDGTNWSTINGVYAGQSTPSATITANGLVRLTPAGLAQFRITSTAWTSGTATISMRASDGTGGTFLNQSLTAGTNTIGAVNLVVGTSIRGASGNVANAAATATLTGTATTTVYITSFSCIPGGSTTAAVVNPTITGTLGGTLTYTAASPASATSVGNTVQQTFTPPFPASAVNTPIVVTMPALGIGNTNATCVATGFHL